MIPEELQNNIRVLKERGFDYNVSQNGLRIYIWFKNFPLPSGLYNMDKTDLLIFTTCSYPNAGFDMFWTDTNLVLKNGNVPKQAECIEPHLQQNWRRFSYHPYNSVHWDPTQDDVVKFIEYVQQRLRNGD